MERSGLGRWTHFRPDRVSLKSKINTQIDTLESTPWLAGSTQGWRQTCHFRTNAYFKLPRPSPAAPSRPTLG